MKSTKQVVEIAWKNGFVIPAFNVPYLPMVKPVIEAVRDENSFALVEVARLEWEKFHAKSLKDVRAEYEKWKDTAHTRLHLDHVPVIDEDHLKVDYVTIIKEAISLGFESLMVDGTRLSLEDNIAATKKICDIGHQADLPVEAELGAVLGHEAGEMPPYEEIFKSGQGFTKVEEAKRFVEESGCDWLSVAIGNVHGAISDVARDNEKPVARLNIDHLKKLNDATGIPLVLHGGSGIDKAYIMESIKNGIAKINVGTEIRHAYEKGLKAGDEETAREYTYKKTREVLREFFEISGTADIINK